MSETLVVVSKIKKHIKEKSDMSTSGSVMDALTRIVMHECDKAIENAKKQKRKTVMDRDFHHDAV